MSIFSEMSPFSHYAFWKTFECPVIIICYSLYFSPFMVIVVKRTFMFFTTADQM